MPFIYAYDSDPYNKLGGEYIIMSKVGNPSLLADASDILRFLSL